MSERSAPAKVYTNPRFLDEHIKGPAIRRIHVDDDGAHVEHVQWLPGGHIHTVVYDYSAGELPEERVAAWSGKAAARALLAQLEPPTEGAPK